MNKKHSITFPVYLKNPDDTHYVVILSESEWEDFRKTGDKWLHTHTHVKTLSDRTYLQDILKTAYQKLTEEQWKDFYDRVREKIF